MNKLIINSEGEPMGADFFYTRLEGVGNGPRDIHVWLAAAGTEGGVMACPEEDLLETELRPAAKRWTDLEDHATAAIRDADPDSNEYLAQAHRARAATKQAQRALDDHLIFHRCGTVAPKAAANQD